MATAPAAPGSKKLSFAKVAASGTKENMPNMAAPRVAVPTMDPRRPPSTPTTTAKNGTIAVVKTDPPPEAAKAPLEKSTNMGVPKDQKSAESVDSTLDQGMEKLNISSAAVKTTLTPSLVVNGSSSSIEEAARVKNESGTASSDNVSQKADSSSEIGTKAPSLDGKSITSGTTFAMDEKESLRPDDSASVKAAVEDDEAFSIRGSQMAISRMGSQIARVHSLRIGDMPERQFVQMVVATQEQGIITPRSGSSEQPAAAENAQAVPAAGTPDAFSSMYSQNPDEKLLEAMSSPKDRLFLLRLEQEVINFVQSSKEPFMDLPPNNSFCRMLTHKLADYYHMTHSFEGMKGTVRIFRTPFCRVPPSLASLVGETKSKTTPPVMLPKKIMRRGEDDGSGQASTSPSKATSEVGSDGKEKAPAKEKPTREQREEAYNKARERIFGSSEKTGESTPEDDANGVSRASSVSAKEKSNLGKRGKTGKQRRDDSESFESRSQYTPYYPPNPQQMSWPAHFIPAGAAQFNGQVQQPYPHPMAQTYPQPGPNYSQMMSQGPINGYPQYNTMPAYPPQPPQQRFSPATGPAPGYASPMQPPPPQTWQQPNYNNQAPATGPVHYQQPSRGPQPQPQPQGGSSAPHPPMGIPYAYGQLPAHVNPNDPKSQHPIPGSFPGGQNRHAFNPKTPLFVPGSVMSPVQVPLAPYNMNAPPHGSPQVGSPHLAYSGYNSPAPPQTYMGTGPGFGMSRQGSNNSLPAYHSHGSPPQHLRQHPGPHLSQQMPPQMLPQMGNQMGPQQMNHQVQNSNMQPPQNRPLNQQFSSLPNYGNPATLPQKPPAGI